MPVLDTHTFLLHLLLILVFSRLLAECAVFLKASAVIGEFHATWAIASNSSLKASLAAKEEVSDRVW